MTNRYWFESMVAFNVTVHGFKDNQEIEKTILIIVPVVSNHAETWIKEAEEMALDYFSKWEDPFVKSIEWAGNPVTRSIQLYEEMLLDRALP